MRIVKTGCYHSQLTLAANNNAKTRKFSDSAINKIAHQSTAIGNTDGRTVITNRYALAEKFISYFTDVIAELT